MTGIEPDFSPFAQRMRAENLPEVVIRTFEFYYRQLASGETGLIPESEIQPVTSLPDAEALPGWLSDVGQDALSKTIMLKLNGGLGTSMGLNQAKSLLAVKDGLSFLDVIARQAQRTGVRLVLMNSFNTRDDSLAILQKYPDLWDEIPLDFLQHKVPKVSQADLRPIDWPHDPNLAWCPPGHGDIYIALTTSGLLDRLLEAGYAYAFVSNADNLGAIVDTTILGYFAHHRLPFLMEVADRTAADRKGGHLAQRPDGRLILRESAQCPEEDTAAFQDITRHRYFNTNNLWIDLAALREILAERQGILGLPMIRNSKTVDPADPGSPAVYQLETAMGAAIALFDAAGAIRVPRTRFAPVKTTDDLLAVRSDAFLLNEAYQIVPNPARTLGPIVVSLDPRYYRLIDDLEMRFPYGPPSLITCQELSVRGDVRFGRDVVVRGAVRLVNDAASQIEIPDGTVLDGEQVHRQREP